MNKKLYTLSFIALLFAGNVIVAHDEISAPEQEIAQAEQHTITADEATEVVEQTTPFDKAKAIVQSKAARTTWAITKTLFGTCSTVIGLLTHSNIVYQNGFKEYPKSLFVRIPKTIATGNSWIKGKENGIISLSLPLRILYIGGSTYSALPLGIYALYSGCNDIKNLYYEKHENLDHEIMEENHE